MTGAQASTSPIKREIWPLSTAQLLDMQMQVMQWLLNSQEGTAMKC